MATSVQVGGMEFNCVAIPLVGQSGKYAVVDVADFPLVSRFRWHASPAGYNNRFYAGCYRNGRTLKMHRLLLGLPTLHVDHIDGDGLNNRRFNLRTATASQNQANRGPRRGSRTGYKGIYFQKTSCKYVAAIQFHGKLRHIGLFADPIEAAKAYDAKAKELFREFAKTNFEVQQ